MSSEPELEIVSGEIRAFLVDLDFEDFEDSFCGCFLLVAGLGAIVRMTTLSKTEKIKTKNNRKTPQQQSYIDVPGIMPNTEYTALACKHFLQVPTNLPY